MVLPLPGSPVSSPMPRSSSRCLSRTSGFGLCAGAEQGSGLEGCDRREVRHGEVFGDTSARSPEVLHRPGGCRGPSATRLGAGGWSLTVGFQGAAAPLSLDEAVGVQIDLAGLSYRLPLVHDLHRRIGP